MFAGVEDGIYAEETLPTLNSYYCSLYRKRVMLTEKDLGKDCKDHVYCTWVD